MDKDSPSPTNRCWEPRARCGGGLRLACGHSLRFILGRRHESIALAWINHPRSRKMSLPTWRWAITEPREASRCDCWGDHLGIYVGRSFTHESQFFSRHLHNTPQSACVSIGKGFRRDVERSLNVPNFLSELAPTLYHHHCDELCTTRKQHLPP